MVEKYRYQKQQDITLHGIDLADHIIKTTVHKSYTVYVIVSCILAPMPTDFFGPIKISSILSSMEEKLHLLVNDDYVNGSIRKIGIKQYLYLKTQYHNTTFMSWTVKMWQFGKYSLAGYSGEKFEIK